MEVKTVYHGSNVEAAHPRILQNGFYKDFGYGFYCTAYAKQAKRWAITRSGNAILNKYAYQFNNELKLLLFEDGYDIVEGPMADDQIWNFVESYAAGRISKTAFWELAKFNYPTHQIVFCTENALKTLCFEGSETL